MTKIEAQNVIFFSRTQRNKKKSRVRSGKKHHSRKTDGIGSHTEMGIFPDVNVQVVV